MLNRSGKLKDLRSDLVFNGNRNIFGRFESINLKIFSEISRASMIFSIFQ